MFFKYCRVVTLLYLQNEVTKHPFLSANKGHLELRLFTSLIPMINLNDLVKHMELYFRFLKILSG